MKAYAATLSEEERKMKYNTRGRKVRCVETNEIFNTVTEAQKAKHCSVLSALKGVYETSGGYHWEYLDNKNYDYFKRYKKVRCIETGEVFESILEANKKYKGKIGGCCSGQRKTAAGYH